MPTSCLPLEHPRTGVTPQLNRWLLALLLVMLAGCGAGRTPLDEITERHSGVPDLSITLADMQKVGGLLPIYYHKYQVVHGDAAAGTLQTETTDWLKVKPAFYKQYADDLGMTLVSRSEGGSLDSTPKPAGYQYVGNEKYGQWRSDGHGGSFWEFYGKWMFMSHMFNMISGPPISRGYYDDYRSHYSSGRRWYGQGNDRQFGTGGATTRKANPAFFERATSSSKGFANKVGDRMGRGAKTGRNLNSMRGRSGSFGK